jgi:hypothetical protein
MDAKEENNFASSNVKIRFNTSVTRKKVSFDYIRGLKLIFSPLDLINTERKMFLQNVSTFMIMWRERKKI